jgi:hypothetical protein
MAQSERAVVELGDEAAPCQAVWARGLWRRSQASRLKHVVASSLNHRSRSSRLAAMENRASAELLLWNLMTWVEDAGAWGGLADLAGVPSLPDPQVYYWGAHERHEFPLNLSQVLRGRFQEHSASHTEPDVMVLAGDQLLLLVLDRPVLNRVPLDRYVQTMAPWFQDGVRAKAATRAAMIRNWAVGATIAERLRKSLQMIGLTTDPEAAASELNGVFAQGRFQIEEFPGRLAGVDPGLRLMILDQLSLDA